jgi:hypothetical protein
VKAEDFCFAREAEASLLRMFCPWPVRYSRSMTRKEAEQQCARLASEHPDRETHQWRPRRETNGDWSIMKIALPPLDLKRQAELRG